ncbi:hypothetical protein CYMTET_30482 [Cymbomonas tetramitiformis]|uniref:Uncharacterized protein n=1 Tax=Cymbomonas tetramitiformis TaxID=36881 RepID=A0AAE0FJD6_9CHLO|nr:hypothetical protein CYMTET_30482 [Cymbomonas tetramitiformis]
MGMCETSSSDGDDPVTEKSANGVTLTKVADEHAEAEKVNASMAADSFQKALEEWAADLMKGDAEVAVAKSDAVVHCALRLARGDVSAENVLELLEGLGISNQELVRAVVGMARCQVERLGLRFPPNTINGSITDVAVQKVFGKLLVSVVEDGDKIAHIVHCALRLAGGDVSYANAKELLEALKVPPEDVASMVMTHLVEQFGLHLSSKDLIGFVAYDAVQKALAKWVNDLVKKDVDTMEDTLKKVVDIDQRLVGGLLLTHVSKLLKELKVPLERVVVSIVWRQVERLGLQPSMVVTDHSADVAICAMRLASGDVSYESAKELLKALRVPSEDVARAVVCIVKHQVDRLGMRADSCGVISDLVNDPVQSAFDRWAEAFSQGDGGRIPERVDTVVHIALRLAGGKVNCKNISELLEALEVPPEDVARAVVSIVKRQVERLGLQVDVGTTTSSMASEPVSIAIERWERDFSRGDPERIDPVVYSALRLAAGPVSYENTKELLEALKVPSKGVARAVITTVRGQVQRLGVQAHFCSATSSIADDPVQIGLKKWARAVLMGDADKQIGTIVRCGLRLADEDINYKNISELVAMLEVPPEDVARVAVSIVKRQVERLGLQADFPMPRSVETGKHAADEHAEAEKVFASMAEDSFQKALEEWAADLMKGDADVADAKSDAVVHCALRLARGDASAKNVLELLQTLKLPPKEVARVVVSIVRRQVERLGLQSDLGGTSASMTDDAVQTALAAWGNGFTQEVAGKVDGRWSVVDGVSEAVVSSALRLAGREASSERVKKLLEALEVPSENVVKAMAATKNRDATLQGDVKSAPVPGRQTQQIPIDDWIAERCSKLKKDDKQGEQQANASRWNTSVTAEGSALKKLVRQKVAARRIAGTRWDEAGWQKKVMRNPLQEIARILASRAIQNRLKSLLPPKKTDP